MDKIAELRERTRLTDEEISKLTIHWNPIPSRIDGISPKTIELRLFKAVAQAQLDKIFRDKDLAIIVDDVRECADEDGVIQKYKAIKYIPLATEEVKDEL